MQTLRQQIFRQLKGSFLNQSTKDLYHNTSCINLAYGKHLINSRYSSNRPPSKKLTSVEDFELLYALTKEKFLSKKLPKDVNARGVFACNELDLSEVNVYGFDYDYTLACYKPCLHDLLYNLGRNMLIKKLKNDTVNLLKRVIKTVFLEFNLHNIK